jgi:hypothetical protein
MTKHAPKLYRRCPPSVFSYRPELEELELRLTPSVDLLTWRGNVGGNNSGANLYETLLTPANVNESLFGQLFSYPVDGQVYAEPLVKTNVAIPGKGTHNVVFVATEHDSVYAFDADGNGGANPNPLWHVSFINPVAGITTAPSSATGSADITPEIGITATPTIDPATGTLYVVSKTQNAEVDGIHYVQQLHALNIATGAEKFGGPVVIGDTVQNGGPDGGYTDVTPVSLPGTGDSSSGTSVFFNALRENELDGLLLAGHNDLYLSFTSHGDTTPYHGWLLGYNSQTLRLETINCTTPNGTGGAIWMGRGSPIVDATGNVYFATGNGTFDAASSGPDYGTTTVKLSPNENANGQLPVLTSFTPHDEASLNVTDLDQGSGGVLLLPDSAGSVAHPHLLVQTGKTGRIYLLDRDNLGGFSATDRGAVQILPDGTVGGGSFDTPAYFNNGTQQLIYYMGASDVLKSFAIDGGQISIQPFAETAQTFGFPGANPAISANGTTDGIIWVLDTSLNGTGEHPASGPAVLHAYDATTLQELYNSSQRPTDQLGDAVKFTVPTVVNGKVYVGTQTGLHVFGLLPVATGGFTVTATEGKNSGPQAVATFTDPEGASSLANYSASIAWGDNSTSVAAIAFNAATATFTVGGSHTYAEEGNPTILVTIHKDSAPAVMVTSSAEVSDPAVVAKGGFILSAGEGSNTGNQTVATFTDPGGAEPLSDYSAAINWGDNSSSTGTITFNAATGMFSVSGNHIYGEQGTLTITVTILHDAASAATATGSAHILVRSDITGLVGKTGQWWVGQSTGSSFSNSLWAAWNPNVTWVDVVTGDFNGDGRTDTAGRVLQTGEWWVGISDGSSFTTTLWTTWNPNVTWVDVKVGDFDGDGQADIVGRVLQTGQWWEAQSTGSSFSNSLWTTWNPNVTWVDVNVGDFNGDGKADIVGRVLQSGDWWVGISNGSTKFTNTRWDTWNPNVTWVDVQVGDFTGDGKSDITGRVLQSGDWWTGVSTGKSFTTSLWTSWNGSVVWADIHTGDYA